jgi:hypothetical protein
MCAQKFNQEYPKLQCNVQLLNRLGNSIALMQAPQQPLQKLEEAAAHLPSLRASA